MTKPTLVVAVGMPGSGKTTLLKPFAENNKYAYVSTDAIRAKMFGNPLVQTNKEEVWKEANRQVEEALKHNQSLIYDSTFAEKEKRQQLIMEMREMGWKHIIGVHVNTPFEIAKDRNRNREHVVPESELDKFFVDPLTTNPPSLSDGFDELYTLDTYKLFEEKYSR